MSAYWIAHVTVHDPVAYAGYQELAPAAFARFATAGVRIDLRRLLVLVLLSARAALAGLGTAFGGGALAAIVRFVFGHGQSSLGAVGETGRRE